MSLNPFLVAALVAALAVAAVAEILIAYQKYQMKKQFMRELDGVSPSHTPAPSSLDSGEKKGQLEEEKKEERESKSGRNRPEA